jgi:hypothetical protein
MIEFRATQSKQRPLSWDYLADCKSAIQQTASLRYAPEAHPGTTRWLLPRTVQPFNGSTVQRFD